MLVQWSYNRPETEWMLCKYASDAVVLRKQELGLGEFLQIVDYQSCQSSHRKPILTLIKFHSRVAIIPF